MKKKTLLYSIALLVLAFSCTKEEDIVKINATVAPAAISAPIAGSSTIITKDNLGTMFHFGWSQADYGVNSPITYVLEADTANNSFANALTLGTSLADTISLTLGDLNDKLLNMLKVTPNLPSTIELRVKSTLNGQQLIISQTSSVKITPYQKVIVVGEKPLTLWVPGEYQNWSPATAPTIEEISPKVYEGYVYIKQGSGFKFTSSPDWDHINYGDGGTYGVLSTDGLANSLGVGTAAYYKFKVDVDKLTYEIYGVNSWGAIGTATPGNWDSSTPMTYSVAGDVWSITLGLKAGALKFRANDDWGLNYGPADSNALAGTLIQTDAAITIPADGNYTITLDFSKSAAPFQYQYTVVKN